MSRTVNLSQLLEPPSILVGTRSAAGSAASSAVLEAALLSIPGCRCPAGHRAGTVAGYQVASTGRRRGANRPRLPVGDKQASQMHREPDDEEQNTGEDGLKARHAPRRRSGRA